MYTFIHVARRTDHFFNRPMATQFTFDDGAVGIRIVFRPSDIGLVGNEIEWASGRVFRATRNRAVTAAMSPNPRKRSLSIRFGVKFPSGVFLSGPISRSADRMH